jgi:hypothetical protein
MRILVTCSLFFALCHISSVKGEEPEPAMRSIDLSTPDDSFVFGRDVQLEIRYRNDAKQPWVVPKPDESAFVGLRFGPSETDMVRGGYDFGRVQVSREQLPDGTTMTSRLHPMVEPVSVAPSEAYVFSAGLQRDWTGNLKPGRWTVRVVDRNLELESNRIDIPLRFTEDSVLACLEISRDKEAHLFKRKWHGEYLQKIMPELQLRWWRDYPTEPPAQEREQMEEGIQRELDRFEAFWKDEDNRPEITAAIARINREAGLDEPRQ